MSTSKVTKIGGFRPPRLFIAEWMKKKGLTQADIAGRLEVESSGTISKKLKNPAKMSAEWLAKFAWALDLEKVEQLYHHPDQPRPEDLWKDADASTRSVVIRILEAAKKAG